jgi:recombination protein RecR
MTTLDLLIQNLSKLPGVGKKSAGRMAHYLLKAQDSYNRALAEQIATLKSKIKECSVCGNFTEQDVCEICADNSRQRNLICVVEQPEDIQTIEQLADFNGLYHVLGGVIAPMEGIGPSDLRSRELISRISEQQVEEIILALNPTIEGETTGLYLHKLLEPIGIKVTKLASGLPFGGDIEYADKRTLSRSFEGRIRMK